MPNLPLITLNVGVKSAAVARSPELFAAFLSIGIFVSRAVCAGSADAAVETCRTVRTGVS